MRIAAIDRVIGHINQATPLRRWPLADQRLLALACVQPAGEGAEAARARLRLLTHLFNARDGAPPACMLRLAAGIAPLERERLAVAAAHLRATLPIASRRRHPRLPPVR
ncbi:hypothetical protein J2T57_001299 [Natronocella acetinitrilica]|uniref:Uncharacterized protein n=1 Tax=Natronocella acetinitrilica TaxID=414046 RepID=A0AAE3KFL7_9GAMM|nr:hypothetical protein [Natronocella acetinitrilica]MCP1674197.1 hypothetical protein [Natronocella acetinitrilica]